MRLEAEHHRSPHIGLTPLIDVVFILLVFFMLATRFGQFHDMPVDIRTGAPADPAEKQWLQVQVRADGQLRIGETAVTPDAIANRLQSQHAGVWLTPAAETRVQQALSALDAIKGAGIESVQLELLP